MEHEGEEFRPGAIGEEGGSEFGNGVAELLGDGAKVVAVEGREQGGFESGAGGFGEAGPEGGVAGGENLAEEDGGEGSGVGVRGGGEDVGELEGERIGLVELAEVEEGFRLGALGVVGGHEVGDQKVEVGGVGAKKGGELGVLELSQLGRHC